MNENLAAALKYASEKNWSIIALSPNTKIPIKDSLLQPNGSLSATTDPDTITKLFTTYPKAGVGVVCGSESDLTVVDLDSKETLGHLKEAGLTLPATYMVRTPRGRHYYLKYDPNIKQTAGLLEHVDIRSDGGYVVAPPTVIGEKTYTLVDDLPLKQWPELADYQKAQNNVQRPRTGVADSPNGLDQPSHIANYLREGAPEGQRHKAVVELCVWLIHRHIPLDVAFEILEPFRVRCTPPYPENNFQYDITDCYRRYTAADGLYVGEDVSVPVVDKSIANRRVFRWVDENLMADVTEITKNRHSIECILVFSEPQTEAHIYGEVRLNLWSASGREGMIRQLRNKRENLNWAMILDQISHLVSASLKEEGAGIDMRFYTPQEEDPGWCVRPFFQRGTPAVFFGAGGKGKSTLVRAILLSKATGRQFIPNIDVGTPAGVMFCDWEDTEFNFRMNCAALLKGMGMTWDDVIQPVVYKHFAGALSDFTDSIQRDISRHNIQLLVIDSLVASAGMDAKDESAARVWHEIVKSFGIASIGITHLAKTGLSEEQDGHPYGSVFYTNLARSVWQVSREDEVTGSSVLAITNTKSNNTGLLKPAGIRTDVESNDDGLAIKIEYSEADLNETETLVKKVSTYDRIMGLLKHMAYHPREISEELNIPDSTIRSTLRRAVNRGEITQLANGQYKAIEKV